MMESTPAGGLVGAGFDELPWPRPVRPGDELRVESEVLEVRPSKSGPREGLRRGRTRTVNRKGEVVLVLIGTLVVGRRWTEGVLNEMDPPLCGAVVIRQNGERGRHHHATIGGECHEARYKRSWYRYRQARVSPGGHG